MLADLPQTVTWLVLCADSSVESSAVRSSPPKVKKNQKAKGGIFQKFSLKKKSAPPPSHAMARTAARPSPHFTAVLECGLMPCSSRRFDEDSSMLEPPHARSNSSNPLSKIINLQLANGAWLMSEDLADVLGKPMGKIKEACPVSCKDDMETIWATIIVLSYLQLQHSQFKDEWELVAEKAKTWLGKQDLPKGCSINVLSEKGDSFLS